MTSSTFGIAVLLLVGGGVLSPAAGQGSGVPVRGGGIGQGLRLGVDVGLGRSAASGAAPRERSRAIAVSGSLGFGPAGASIGVARSRFDPETGPTRDRATLMVGAAVTVFGGPLVPLSVAWTGGVDRQLDGSGSRPWRGYLGLGAALVIPATVVSIRPWIAPRLDYLDNQPGSDLRGALSAGIDLGLLSGLGFRFSYDSRLGWDRGDQPASGIGIGVSYHFR